MISKMFFLTLQGHEVDIFSIGRLIYYVISGGKDYFGMELVDRPYRIKYGDTYDELETQLVLENLRTNKRSIFKRTLSKLPEYRPRLVDLENILQPLNADKFCQHIS